MKRCPQCNSVYEDDVRFCKNEGAALVEENFTLPSAQIEEDTIIRTNPIVVNLEEPEQVPPSAESVENIVVFPTSRSLAARNYALFLVVGLLVGGTLVLATLMFARGYFQSDKNEKTAVNAAENRKPENETNAETENLDAPFENENTVSNADEKHSEANTEIDENELNGRVITLNAHVRHAPDANAAEIEVLPENDRLKIIRRENEKSPWYEVVCEHGTTGWMHGNTIEFTDSY